MDLHRCDPATLESLLDQLHYDLSEDEVKQCLRNAKELLTALDRRDCGNGGAETDKSTPERSLSDDPYNALLDIYRKPRRETATGPLAGISVVIKDNIATKNLRMTCGLRGLEYVPKQDAAVVERLLAAGATILGKANMYGLAIGPDNFSEWGRVENPTYPSRIPGGSSSGSAAAVAGGLANAAIGSDTGGSVRFPAAFCGLVGMKPTSSAIPRHGLVPLVPSLDSIGIIANDVAQTEKIFHNVMRQGLRKPVPVPLVIRQPTIQTDEESLTIGIPGGSLTSSVDGVRTRIESLLRRAEQREDAYVTPVRLETGFESVYTIIRDAEFSWLVRQRGVTYGTGSWFDPEWLAEYREYIDGGIKDDIAIRMFPGAICDEQTKGEAYAKCRRIVFQLQERLTEVFKTCDILITPTVPVFPPKAGNSRPEEASERDLALYTRICNLAGVPAVAVPAGEVNGLPVSVQVVAPRNRDDLALRGAKLIEKLR